MVKKAVVLGVGGALGHDGNAAIIVDGKLIASSQEERFTRVKHDGRFPVHAIQDCLEMAGLKLDDVTACVFAEKPVQNSLFKTIGRSNSKASRWLGNLLPPAWSGWYTEPARQILRTRNSTTRGIISLMLLEPSTLRPSTALPFSVSMAKERT